MTKFEKPGANEISRAGHIFEGDYNLDGSDQIDMRWYAGGMVIPSANGVLTFEAGPTAAGPWATFKDSAGADVTMTVTANTPQAMPVDVFSIAGWMRITGSGTCKLGLKG